MNCQVYLDGSCGNGGQNWYVRNTNTSQAFRANIEVLEDGRPFGWRDQRVGPGGREPLNVCSLVGGKRYTCIVRGETPVP